MKYGTAHFCSLDAAIEYYRQYYLRYDLARAAVVEKIKAGEIFIGEPALKPGQTLELNKQEGRYFISEGAQS